MLVRIIVSSASFKNRAHLNSPSPSPSVYECTVVCRGYIVFSVDPLVPYPLFDHHKRRGKGIRKEILVQRALQSSIYNKYDFIKA